MENMTFIYLIIMFCVSGSWYTGIRLGRKQGVENLLGYLDSRKNKKTNKVTLIIDGDTVKIS
jgi:hypothetical protein